jgi:FdhD protein
MGRSNQERNTVGGTLMRKLKSNHIKGKTNVCEETPIDLTVNGKNIVTFMCTPQNLKELAVGYLYIQGIINEVDEINYLAACEDMDTINVGVNGNIDDSYGKLKDVLASSCGKALDDDKLRDLGKVDSKIKISLSKIKKMAKKMFSDTVLYKKTGGVHCAAISDYNDLIDLKEDVGRHNAVDKIVGQSILKKLDFANCIIFTSGRISSDMVLKVATSKFPIVVSRSIPSSLALEIAEKANITVIGRIMRREPIIYTKPERIICD